MSISRLAIYGFLLRVPLLTAVGVVAFCIAALFTGLGPLFGNAFDVGGSWGIFYVSLTAFLCGWVVMVTWRLVRLYGGARSLNTATFQIPPNLRRRDLIHYSPIAFCVVIGVVWRSTALPLWLELPEAALGLLISLLCLALVDGIQRWLTRSQFAGQRPEDDAENVSDIARKSPALFLPAGMGPVEPVLDALSEKDPTPHWFLDAIEGLFRRVPPEVGRGYFEYGEDNEGRPEFRSILPGHVAALTLFLLTLAVYFVIGYMEFDRLRDGRPPSVPALCYVLLLAMLVCWGLSGLAFLLDRWRIPVLIPVIILLISTSLFPSSDYFYPAISPVTADQNAAPPKDDSIIVVAANGGGIQAAAWTAKVLTGLEKRCREECERGFGGSVRAISSASGGSVGTMYFVNEYGADGGLPEQNEELNDIVTRAEMSSLDSIGWGLVYPDLGRTLVPYKREWDRGRALEQSWLRSHMAWEKRGGIREGLSEWRNEAIADERPAVIFNATVAETGKPVTFNTLPTTKAPNGNHDPLELVSSYRGLFEEGEEETDVKVVTAVRLSAAFPYVSPAARADPEKVGEEAPHIVDGGYYDNYGIASLVEWLDTELTRNNRIKNVLVIEIRGGPSESGLRDEDAGSCSPQPVAKQDLGSKRRWIYQLLAPAQTVLNVRNPAQRARNDVELDLLQDKWKDSREHSVTIERALFEFDCPNPPLSWHLTEDQKDDIDKEWRDEIDDETDQGPEGSGNEEGGWAKVKRFLADPTTKP